MDGERPSWALIDLAALRSNFELAQRLAGEREVIAVVKADAYGHGAPPVASALADLGCRRFAVVTVREAAELREVGSQASLLVLGGVHDAREAALACELELTPVLHHRDGLELLCEAAREAARPLPVHVEVDSGMHRMGVPAETAVDLLAAVASEPSLELAGVFTHFACADDPSPEACLEQLARFRTVLAGLRERGIRPGLVHTDNSAALLAGPPLTGALAEARAVRPGLMLYGARPAPHLDADARLQPVMSVRTRVVALRDVAAGEGVGYGASYRPPSRTRIATLPIGYADGVLRSVFSRAAVWLAGARRPIVGRISMDYITVDVGDAPVGLGDEATFFGSADAAPSSAEPRPGVPVEEVAEAAGTIAYELLVRVGGRVPRRLVGAL